MTDHKTDAGIWIDNAISAQASDVSDFLAAPYAAIAQVHATLYLAEQQRIANLIALATPFALAGGSKPEGFFDVFAHPDSEFSHYDLNPAIKEGLGI